MFDTANTMDDADLAKENEVYRALMLVKPADLPPTRWATDAGFARNLFTNIRAHGRPRLETIRKLLDVIDVSEAQFEAAKHPQRELLTEVRATPLRDVTRRFTGEPQLPGVPLVGSGVGGIFDDLDEHIELTCLYEDEVLGHVDRPSLAAADPTAYALTVIGDSMDPACPERCTIVASPRVAPSPGDIVVVQLRSRDERDDRVRMVLIKRLVRRAGGVLTLEQFNPRKTFDVPTTRVVNDQRGRPAIHRVVAIYP